MTIANYISVNPEMMSTRTAKDFCALLGASPHNLGIAARLYEKHTASYFTEAFGNVVNVNSKSESKYQPINSLMVEWEVEVQNVPRIPFATSVPDTFRQARGVDIPMAFTEKYYGVNDTFIIDESKQICVVIDEPIRKADNMWEYAVQLIDADFNAELDTEACLAGCLTRWIGNIKPELHETGNVKYTSNYQKMRSWIGEMRFQADVSDRYLAMEDTFVKVSRESESGTKNYLFKLPAIKKVLLDNFMDGRNNQMIWGKSTMDEQGHCTVRDRQGRDLICGDGIVAQINRYACKYAYTKLSANVLTEALSVLAEKCEESIGNTFIFVVNDVLFRDLQHTLSEFLAQHRVDQQFMYSKYDDKKIKVGATYSAFEWAGNTVVFRIDRALSNEYPHSGYGILIDMTSDKVSGDAPIKMFTLKDRAFVENSLNGVGTKQGEVASLVAGATYSILGYCGIGCMNPYRSYVLIQN